MQGRIISVGMLSDPTLTRNGRRNDLLEVKLFDVDQIKGIYIDVDRGFFGLFKPLYRVKGILQYPETWVSDTIYINLFTSWSGLEARLFFGLLSAQIENVSGMEHYSIDCEKIAVLSKTPSELEKYSEKLKEVKKALDELRTK
jgi:hypothetical protein